MEAASQQQTLTQNTMKYWSADQPPCPAVMLAFGACDITHLCCSYSTGDGYQHGQ